MESTIVLTVNVVWDEKEKMFVATSDDIPGLVTEAKTFPKLMERVEAVAPDLLELNNELQELPGSIIAYQQSHYRHLNG